MIRASLRLNKVGYGERKCAFGGGFGRRPGVRRSEKGSLHSRDLRGSRTLLHVDADERAAAGLERDEITHKALLGAKLDMAGAFAAIDQHASHGGLVGIGALDLPEAGYSLVSSFAACLA